MERLESLVHDTNDTCAALRASLTDAITVCPPLLRANQVAGNDLTSITIEICLIKLSLIRAKAHASLYGVKSPINSAAAMPQALSTAQSRMKEDERRLVTEDRALDKELSEYTRLLELVDGPDGGFAQVVEDWMTIHKETEECRRDLRRLGWTED
ncbi:hypothetical protein FIBSPDRAFT_871303 [Athelia psychrophila]|uniref:Uncharacterized protein n=1 Tax=Athelia psychrophila TaxID=1759441 RepID=A0A166ADR8_9AGAM|nr:hypothetical protein FIBSPDRAFT_871303 [Fibularhizoctonia sp. CBS 109695]